jgi:hypothetical protein
MTPSEFELERSKQRAFQRLGTNEPRCATCGEVDWRCHELDHIAGRAYDQVTTILCCNCHRKKDYPRGNAKSPADPPLLECIGHFLLGLAELLLLAGAKAKEFGTLLLDGAKVCPRPWGWQPVVGEGI